MLLVHGALGNAATGGDPGRLSTEPCGFTRDSVFTSAFATVADVDAISSDVF